MGTRVLKVEIDLDDDVMLGSSDIENAVRSSIVHALDNDVTDAECLNGFMVQGVRVVDETPRSGRRLRRGQVH